MKRTIIAAVVAAVIIFAWQAFSWMVLPTHSNAMQYTSTQNEILTALSDNLKEDGVYAIPTVDPADPNYEEKFELQHEEMEGKPWAMVFYHASYQNEMTRQFILGFVFSLITSLAAVYLLRRIENPTVSRLWASVMIIPIAIVFQSILTEWNWFNHPASYSMGNVVDAFVGWGLAGYWLAKYIGKERVARG